MSKSHQKLDVILENKVIQIANFSKNVHNKKCAPKIIFFNRKEIERFGSFLLQKIDFESQNFAIFDNFSQLPARLKNIKGILKVRSY